MRLIQSVVIGLLAGVAWAPAQAQGVPQGSYLRSCGNVAVQGDTLIAIVALTSAIGITLGLPPERDARK